MSCYSSTQNIVIQGLTSPADHNFMLVIGKQRAVLAAVLRLSRFPECLRDYRNPAEFDYSATVYEICIVLENLELHIQFDEAGHRI